MLGAFARFAKYPDLGKPLPRYSDSGSLDLAYGSRVEADLRLRHNPAVCRGEDVGAQARRIDLRNGARGRLGRAAADKFDSGEVPIVDAGGADQRRSRTDPVIKSLRSVRTCEIPTGIFERCGRGVAFGGCCKASGVGDQRTESEKRKMKESAHDGYS